MPANPSYSTSAGRSKTKPANGRLAEYGILGLFKFVISSCEAGFEKPDPGIFQIVIDRYRGRYESIWTAGDRIDNDIVPAKKLGWKAVRILQGSHRMQTPKNEFEMPGFTIRRLSELLGMF